MPVGTLDAPTIDAMWATFEAYYDDVDRARFDADLARKDDVILLTAGGQVVGFTTLTVYRGSVDGQDYAALFSGDTVVDRAYWGGTALQRTFAWYAFRFWLRHRHIRAYWYLISKGYKTYLLLVRNWARAWPKHDRPTPPYEQAVLADLGARLFGEAFDAERGVVVFDPPAGRLKDGVAPPDRALSDPDVQHFLQRNPGYVHGEELCCLGRFEAAAFAKFTSRHLFPMLRRRRT